MLYKVLALAALMVQETHAGGGGGNSVDPRALWFRWAVPLGGGYISGQKKYGGANDYEDDKGRSVRKCGVNLAPNSITNCYFTDCYKSLHKFSASSRRLAGGANHYDVAKTICGDMQNAANRRRLANAPALAIQCKTNTCDVPPQIKQFRYWRKGAAATEGLSNLTNPMGNCPGGNDAVPEESWQWYGGAQYPGSNCIYDATTFASVVGTNCQCKTLVCRVSTEKETNLDGAVNAWKTQSRSQQSDECNFIVRIEDWWPSPFVSKKMMWWIFSIAATISLVLTGYYYVKFGDELVKEHGGGGSEGSGGN